MTDVHSRSHPGGTATPHSPPPLKVDLGKLSASAERELMAVLGSSLEAEMQRRWPTYYDGRRVGALAPAMTFTPRQCGFSAIFKVDLAFPATGARQSVIVKIRREQRHGSFARADLSERTLALTRAEYEEHVKAAAFFDGNAGGLSVVRPLDLIESHNALVVEHAAGRDLSKLVNEGSALVPDAISRCGSWWRLFHHELHASRDRAWDVGIIDAAIERRLVRLRRIGAPALTLQRLQQEIGDATRAVPEIPVAVSLVHGDCKLRHVWATREGIQVLDFGNTKVGDSWIDPAALVVELSLYSLWTRRMDSAPHVGEIRTLLRAYFGGPPPPAFSLYVVDCLLKKWHRRLRNWGPGAGLTRLHRSLQVARLDKQIERFYIDRWFATQIRAWLALAGGHPPVWLRPVIE